MKIKPPQQAIAAALGVKSFVWMEAQRIYNRKDGQFKPFGWTGFYVRTWQTSTRYQFIIRDEDI